MSGEKFTTNDSDLFDNPFVRSAMAALTPEQRENYARIGKQMYNGIDFTTSQLTNAPEPMDEALCYINENIKSGLHPSDLTAEERNLLREFHGEKWWEKYGFVKEDLEKIVTVNRDSQKFPKLKKLDQ